MGTIVNNIRWATNSAELAANLKQGLDQIEATKAGAEKLVQTLSGDRLIAAAHKYVAAVQQMGGAAGVMAGAEKLSAGEKERINLLLDKAITKYGLLGQTAPKALLDLAAATKQGSENTGGWLPLLHELGTSWVARIAEGILLRDAIRDIIGKLKEMATALPEIALKGAAVADVEENFKRLTVQAGLLGDKLMGTLREGTHDTVDNFELMKTVNKDLAAGMVLTDKQFGTLAKGAFALAQATGVGVKQAFDTMNDAMLTGRTRSLAELTGKIQTTEAEEKFAAAMKHSADQLTEEGKLQAARVAILRAVTDSTKRLGEQTDGLDERVAQAAVAWSNFKDDLGKTIATSSVLEAGLAGLSQILHDTFGPQQQDIIKGIAKKIEDAEIAVVEFAKSGVSVGGDLVKEYYAVKKVFGDLAQIISGDALAFEFLALGVAKVGEKTSFGEAASKRYADDIKRINENIDSLLISMKNRGAALQEDDKAQAGVDAKTAGYVATLEGLRAKMAAAQHGAEAFIGPIQQVGAENDRGAGAAGRHGDALFKTGEQAKALEKSMRELVEKLTPAHGQFVLLSTQAKVFGSAAEKLVEEADAMGIKVPVAIRQIAVAWNASEIDKLMGKATEQWTKDLNKMNEETQKRLEAFTKNIGDAIIKNDAIARAAAMSGDDEIAKRTLSTADLQRREIAKWVTTQKAAVDTTVKNFQTAYDEIDRAAAEKLANVESDWETLKANSDITLQHTADLAAATYDYMLEHADEFSAGTIERFKKIAEAAQDAADGTRHAWINAFVRIGEAIPGLVQQAFTGGGGLKGAARAGGSLVGSELGKGLVGHLEETAPEFMGSALGKVFGAAIPAIGALAGPLITAIIGLFDHIPEDLERTARNYGVEISDAVMQGIRGDMESLHLTEQAATIFNAAKLFPTVDATNFAAALRVTHDAFSMIQTRQLSVAQGGRVLADMWPKLAAIGTDAYGRISDELKELIRLDDEFGTQSKEIAAFLKSQGSAAASAFNDITAAVLTPDKLKVYDDLKKKVDDAKASGVGLEDALKAQKAGADLAASGLADLGVQALATFTAAVASGTSEADALKLIHPALETLQKTYADLGLDIDDAALKALMMRDKIVTAAPEMVKGLGSLTTEMVALDNMGLMNAKTFGAMQRSGQVMYDQLIGKVKELGGTDADALSQMQDFLHLAADEAKKLGIPLDDNTAKLIQQSKDAGVWQEKLTPQDTLLTGMQTLVDKVNDLVNALLGIPPKVKTTVTVDTERTGDSGLPDGAETARAATGGVMTRAGRVVPFERPTYLSVGRFVSFVPQGTDTEPAMLTPNEWVLNEGQQSSVSRLIEAGASMASDLVSIGRGGTSEAIDDIGPDSGARSGNLNVTVVLGDQKLGSVTRRVIWPALKDHWRTDRPAARDAQMVLEIK